MSRWTVDQFAGERDRLLQYAARIAGLPALVVALGCLCIPGILPPHILLAVVPFLLAVGACLVLVSGTRPLLWASLGIAAGVGALLVVSLPAEGMADTGLASSMVPLAGGAIAAFGIVLTGTVPRLVVFAVGAASSIGIMHVATPGGIAPTAQTLTVLVGWLLALTFSYWFGASVPRAARSIVSIGRAHRAERQASEVEAQRRQSARLLHDTVLATLTLLAHSGVGVSSDALRDQARDDAHLLRQLRLGGSPVPTTTGQMPQQPPAQEIVLGHTLESVKQRFGRMGLDVNWHGSGHVLLPTEVLDAFLLALAECLENVRRHAGVSDAHVTITEDDDTVRAMITDSGVGFNLDEVDAARLGFKESVVGRLSEVGGSARLFSAPGAGTTVVLEVPR